MAIQLLPLLALGALGLGTGLQISSARAQDRALGNALRDLANKRKKRSAEANALFDKSLQEQDVGTAQEQVDTAAADKTARVEDIFAAETPQFAPVTVQGTQGAPRVVATENARALADAVAKARANLSATARLEGYGSRTFDRGQVLQRRGAEFENMAIADRGDQAVYDADAFAAQFAGGNKAMFGDILSTLGQVGLLAYGAGAGGGGGLAKIAKPPNALSKISKFGMGIG